MVFTETERKGILNLICEDNKEKYLLDGLLNAGPHVLWTRRDRGVTVDLNHSDSEMVHKMIYLKGVADGILSLAQALDDGVAAHKKGDDYYDKWIRGEEDGNE